MKYVKIPNVITYKKITQNNYSLSSSQYKDLSKNNYEKFKKLKYFLT